MQKGRRIRRPFYAVLVAQRFIAHSPNKPDGTSQLPEHRQSPFVDDWAVQLREEEFP
jgi:hypothetical protein